MTAAPALAEKKYGPGVTDTEIKIGQTMPYSGPLSAFGTMGRAEAAYFEMVNANGGVNGRKIRLLSLDDGYSPPRTIEQTRKLVESDEVLLLFSSFGTPTNTAAMKYLNTKGVPQLFIAATGMKWGDPKNFPWTMAFLPSQRTGTAGYVQYLLKNRPDAKIAVLYQNDDFGKDYLKALRDHLGARADRMIVAEASYESTDPSVDSQIATLKGSGADTLFSFASPKFAAQSIRKVYDIGWKPLHFVPYSATSVTAVLQPAGLDKSVGRDLIRLREGPDRPAMEERCRHEGMAGVDEEVLSGRGPGRDLQRLRLYQCAAAGPRAEAVRRRVHARER